MTRTVTIEAAGPAVTVQDPGRPGLLACGVSAGGPIDRVALAEGAALLAQSCEAAALELAGSALTLRCDGDVRIALTGAPMRATTGADDAPLAWHASHSLPAEASLRLRPLGAGPSVVSLGGGIATPTILGSRAAHLAAGIGARLAAGAALPLGPDPGGPVRRTLTPAPRFSGGAVRVVPGPQTALFGADALARLAALSLSRGARGNRQGVALEGAGTALADAAGRRLVSDAIGPGDVQVTGDGQPYVLGPECQTTGGYPRIATVIPQDLPIVWQAAPGTALRLTPADLAEARAGWCDLAGLTASVRTRPLVHTPTAEDLLGYQLIGGVTAGEGPCGST